MHKPVLLVVYASITGATRSWVQSFCHGAADESAVTVRLLQAADVCTEDVVAADAYVFACPETLGSMVGEMKSFFDRTYYPVLDQVNGRPYLLVVCAGSDGEPTVRQMQRILTGWRLKPVAEARLIKTHAQTPEAILASKELDEALLQDAEEAGRAMASALLMGIF
ncbi:flavodoxin family protein [Leeia oryzae]|uniref:flavodoxin family protein n=1 Tax=Leeia oryzae TaxID=356662 RepID=UPI0003669700|nr:NAD(P)H-dependent oxidoreductase [Leeia oryzae]